MKKFYFLPIAVLLLATLKMFAQEPVNPDFPQNQTPEYYEVTGVSAPNAEATGEPLRSITELLKDIPEEGIILIPNSGSKAVMAFHPETGALLDNFYIPTDDVNLSTPIEILFTGSSFLISDQLKKLVQEYNMEGEFMGTFAPEGGENQDILHNIRGMHLRENGNVLVTVAGGANAHSVAEFDSAGVYLGNFISNGAGGLNSPWDILYRPDFNDYLISANGSSGIHRYNADGEFIEMFVSSLSFPEQMHMLGNGNILVANFSSPAGVYEYNSQGVQLGYYGIVGGLRGVYELPDETIIVTNASGVHRINRDNQNLGLLASGNGRFITMLKPASFNISLGEDLYLPEGNTANLGENLQMSGGTEPYEFSWSKQGDDWNSTEENPSFTFEDAGTFVFTLEVTDGEELTANAELTVFVYPGLIADAGDDLYVLTDELATLGGDPVSDGGMGEHEFLWTMEGAEWTSHEAHPEVSFEEKGEYVFHLTVTDALENEATDQMLLIVYKELEAHAGEDMEVFTTEDFVLGDDPAASEGVPPYTYLWTLEDSDWTSNEPNPTVNLPDEATYLFTLTVEDDIANTAADQISVTVSIDDTSTDDFAHEAFVIFPNPATENIVVRFPQIQQGDVIVTDLNGREVFIRSMNDKELEINVSQFPAGIYILKAGEYEQKFIVK
ncbi:MAG: T9SS C-terminal target domain-containing protein [Bacteroidetes bacterium]|nr:MAG: T9SS C-terminal target domain-containing protein [Bacteroidota bacterium]